MATARLDIRLDEEIKAKAEKASALLGLKSLTEYVVRLMDEDADQVIAQHEIITLENDVFDEFMAINRAEDAARLCRVAGAYCDYVKLNEPENTVVHGRIFRFA